jgi:hypothetical protein
MAALNPMQLTMTVLSLISRLIQSLPKAICFHPVPSRFAFVQQLVSHQRWRSVLSQGYKKLNDPVIAD